MNEPTLAPLPAADPARDLVLERIIEVPRALVWRVWTEAEHLKEWFTPRPWRVTECDLDVRPGGRFFTVMQGPEGEPMPGEGCYLEVVRERRLVWTDALGAGFRPNPSSFMTAALELFDEGEGTRYVARAFHSTEEQKDQHEKMGFHDGWGTAIDQLVEYAGTLG